MKLHNKIISGLASLGIVGASIVGVNGACVDDKGLTMFPEEEMPLLTIQEGKQKQIGKICFDKKADYVKFRDSHTDKYKGFNAEDRAKYLFGEGEVIDDILDHEIKKIGTVDIEGYNKDDDILLSIITALNL